MTGPARHDLAIYRGDSFTLIVPIIEADDTPYDLTGVDVLAQVRTRAGSDATRGDLIVELVPVVDDPEVGQIVLHLTAEKTAALRPESGVWDLQLSKDGSVWTPLAGAVRISGDVSIVEEEAP